MKLHVKEGVFVDRKMEDGSVKLSVMGDIGDVTFTPEEWAKLTVAGAPVQDEEALRCAAALQMHGRVVDVADRRVLHVNIQFSLESADEEAMFPRVSKALESYARYNIEQRGPAKSAVEIDGVRFTLSYKDEYFCKGLLVNWESNL